MGTPSMNLSSRQYQKYIVCYDLYEELKMQSDKSEADQVVFEWLRQKIEIFEKKMQ
jgi:hypothetical protein